jgi:hypothetical protein
VLDELFAFSELRQQPLSRDLLMEYRAQMLAWKLSPSTTKVRLAAVRKLIGEARRNGRRVSSSSRAGRRGGSAGRLVLTISTW